MEDEDSYRIVAVRFDSDGNELTPTGVASVYGTGVGACSSARQSLDPVVHVVPAAVRCGHPDAPAPGLGALP